MAVGDAIERDTARKAQILLTRSLRQRAGEPQHDLLGHRLDRGRQIHLALGQKLLGLRGLPPNSSSNRPLVMVRPVQ
jgi:hypothetical protein